MKLFVLVLNKTSVLEILLAQFAANGIKGATILNSTGMARTLIHKESSFFGSLRAVLDPDQTENKTILIVLQDEQVATAREIIRQVVGDLSKPDTGISFTIPIDSADGLTR